MTPTNEQVRTQVSGLARELHQVRGQTVKVAFAGQGYTAEELVQVTLDDGIEAQVIKLAEAKKGFVLFSGHWVVKRRAGWLN